MQESVPDCPRCPDDAPCDIHAGDKAQRFFLQLAASARAPHCGVAYREWVSALLIQAQTAGLYTPEKP